jgi:8-oxo-dGTP pyrophosphatase MutT (NUDIX family)
MSKPHTVVLLRECSRVLLGLKKRGFGKGKYTQVGGKLEPGETYEQAMIRECREEIGVTPTRYIDMGKCVFKMFHKGKSEEWDMEIFCASEWTGEPVESDEIKPVWFDITTLPYPQMHEDDIFWFPLVLDGKRIDAFFEFDADDRIIDKRVGVVD